MEKIKPKYEIPPKQRDYVDYVKDTIYVMMNDTNNEYEINTPEFWENKQAHDIDTESIIHRINELLKTADMIDTMTPMISFLPEDGAAMKHRDNLISKLYDELESIVSMYLKD